MLFKKTLLGALLCAPMAAFAATAGGAGNLDVYYVHSNLENGGDEDGDGFGVKGMGRISDLAFVYGEYQAVDYDDSNGEVDQLRAGLGYTFLRQQNMDLYGKLELVHLDYGNEDDTGFGAHAGASFAVAPALDLKAQIGWVDVDNTDGVEYLIGAAYDLNPQWGVFTDYRLSDLETSGGGDFEVSDWRIGARFNF